MVGKLLVCDEMVIGWTCLMFVQESLSLWLMQLELSVPFRIIKYEREFWLLQNDLIQDV